MARTPKVVEDRREHIIQTAMRVFARKGFMRATNKDIAAEAGITPGLIYHYFKSKEALLEAVIGGYSPIQVIRENPAQMLSQPPEIFLRFIVKQMLMMVESDTFLQLIRVFLPEVIHNPNLSPAGLNTLQEVTHFVESYLAAKMESGELRQADPALTAHVLYGTIMGLVLRRHVMRDPEALKFTQEQIVENVMALVLKGLLVE
jgi:AcrR family transcriptional regulator